MSLAGKILLVRRPRRRWLLLLALLGTALLVSQSPFLELFNRRLEANFNRTRLGMTREQVESILGEPQGGSGVYTAAAWEDRHCIVRLRFDNDGRLCRVWATQKHRDSPIRELLRRFGW
jgi:hypothetical protein